MNVFNIVFNIILIVIFVYVFTYFTNTTTTEARDFNFKWFHSFPPTSERTHELLVSLSL